MLGSGARRKNGLPLAASGRLNHCKYLQRVAPSEGQVRGQTPQSCQEFCCLRGVRAHSIFYRK